MADVTTAIMFVLRQEDSRMSGEVTNIAGDAGGRTRYGIAEASHPELTPTGYFDGPSDAGKVQQAIKVYAQEYAYPLSIALMREQQVADAVLSFGVNEGVGTSAKIVQRLLGLSADGEIGAATIGALNSRDGSEFLRSLYTAQLAHYKAIVASNPNDAKFLNGWENRDAQSCGLTATTA